MSAAAARMERARLARYCLNSVRHERSSRSSGPECVYHTLATCSLTVASTTYRHAQVIDTAHSYYNYLLIIQSIATVFLIVPFDVRLYTRKQLYDVEFIE